VEVERQQSVPVWRSSAEDGEPFHVVRPFCGIGVAYPGSLAK
jgi:hypothetical protein